MTTLRGVDAVLSRLTQYERTLQSAVDAALYTSAQEILGDTIPNTPLDTGVLRGSGYVNQPQRDSDGSPYVQIGFGGAATRYAVDQHENLTYRHTVGEAKYLQNALERFERTGRNRLKNLVHQFMR